ncbi:hypothetical protein Leryth_011054 [Lithospermum erythrorhizon]|nr:hypothetical protein Leryth_011054 [Lithospermum erythrorhizon]
MNQHYASQQKSSFAGCGEEMMMRRNSVVICPKPRRVSRFDGVLNDNARSRRWHVSQQQQQDWCDTQAANELFDIILTKGASGGVEQQTVSAVVTVDSPPPLFCGSPPSRVSNPLIQDARFVNGKVTPVSPRAIPVHPGMVSSPLTPTRKGGFMRENFGNNPIVRVEGFDCLDRDRRVGGIPTLA